MSDHAIVVGINSYPGITNLKGPCNDAEKFLAWLRDARGGNVPEENIEHVLSTSYSPPQSTRDAQPVSDQIKEKFDTLYMSSTDRPIGNRLYVFVAGHGMSDSENVEHAALITANASTFGMSLPQVVITKYINFFHKEYAFRELVLVMDCCLDVSVLRNLEDPALAATPPHRNAGKVKIFSAKATKWTKKSFEKDFGGDYHGIFSYTFMEALEKAPSTSPNVTGRAIKAYVEQHIHRIAGEKTVDNPTIDGNGHENIVFYTRTGEQSEDVSNSFRYTVQIIDSQGDEVVDLYDGGINLIDSISATTGVVEFFVGPGLYKVQVQGTDNRYAVGEIVGDYVQKI